MKWSNELAEQIAEDYGSGNHKIEDVCKRNGISKPTWYEWKEKQPYFSDLLKKADQKRLDAFKDMARSGLASLLEVQEYEEERVEYERKNVKVVEGGQEKMVSRPEIKSKTITKKRTLPNATAVIFALKNVDPGNFKDQQHHEHTNGGDKFDFSGMDTEDILKRAKAVKKLSDENNQS